VPTRSDVQFEDEKIQSKNNKKQKEKFQENFEKEKPIKNSDRQLRAQSPLPELIDRIWLPQPVNFPQPTQMTQMTQPQAPPRTHSPPPVMQKR
jgi:hypothetical protein